MPRDLETVPDIRCWKALHVSLEGRKLGNNNYLEILYGGCEEEGMGRLYFGKRQNRNKE